MKRHRSGVLTAAALPFALALLTSCGTATINADDLEKEIVTQLTATVGRAPDDVTCPDDLEAKVAATTRCVLTDGDTKYGISVKVTALNDGNASFDIKVDSAPMS